MNCPFFDYSTVGLCLATERPHIPTLDVMEDYCFKTRFATCPQYELQESGEVVGATSGMLMTGAFGDIPCINETARGPGGKQRIGRRKNSRSGASL